MLLSLFRYGLITPPFSALVHVRVGRCVERDGFAMYTAAMCVASTGFSSNSHPCDDKCNTIHGFGGAFRVQRAIALHCTALQISALYSTFFSNSRQDITIVVAHSYMHIIEILEVVSHSFRIGN